MAIGRLSVKVGKAGRAGPHAAYIARTGIYANRLERGERLAASGTGNMPAWAQADALQFWQAADAYERSNGTTYREMEIALPRDLDEAQREALVRAFVAQEIGGRHAYQWALHVPAAADGGEQPHVHLMFSERQVDGIARDPQDYFRRYNARAPERGGARKGYGPRAGQPLKREERAAELKALRARWEALANQHLAMAGRSERIDMRSHAERGTGLDPEAKQLPSQWRGPGRANVIAFRAARAELAAANEKLRQVVPDLSAAVIDLEQARQARQRRFRAEQQRQRLQHISDLSRRLEVQGEALRQALEQKRSQALSSADVVRLWERERDQRAAYYLTRVRQDERRLLDAVDKALQAQAEAEERHARTKPEPVADTIWTRMSGKARAQAAALEAWNRALEAIRAEWRARLNGLQEQLAQVRAYLSGNAAREAAGQFLRRKKPKLSARYDRAVADLMEQQRLARQAQEAAERQEKARRFRVQVLSRFMQLAERRAQRAKGYSDTGRIWNHLPKELRSLIEDYNAADDTGRGRLLKQIDGKQIGDLARLMAPRQTGRNMGGP